MGDYATLSGGMTLHNNESAHSSLRGTPRDVSTFKLEILCNIHETKTHDHESYMYKPKHLSEKFIIIFKHQDSNLEHLEQIENCINIQYVTDIWY